MRRCFFLARKAGKRVKSNPQVGAILVHKNRIIGEGFHEIYGGPHAEVNAVNSVKDKDKGLIKESTLYVSLEPCRISSKTPPCTDLILKNGIKQLVVSTTDPNPPMAGKSLLHLGSEGVDVTTSILEDEGKFLIAPFQQNLKNRPYITLKWAKSKDNFIGSAEKQIWLTNEYSKTAAHKIRAENDAIFIGTHTAVLDNPQLTTRLYPGSNPLRIVIDKEHEIPLTHHLLSDDFPTLALSQKERSLTDNRKKYVVVDFNKPAFLKHLMQDLFKKGICRIMIEGGKRTLQTFIKENLWDQAYIFNTSIRLKEGIRAPNCNGHLISNMDFMEDRMVQIKNPRA